MKMMSPNIFKASEYQEQCALFEWRAHALPTMPELSMMFGTLNGIRLPVSLAVKAKKQGNVRGVPDVMLLVPSGNYHGLMIEMKIKGGKLLPEQKDWATKARGWGYCCKVCYSATEAIDLIKRYLKGI